MNQLYNLLIRITEFHLNIFGLLNNKLSQGINGRRETFVTLRSQISSSDQTIWLHCASLGEYEQGYPVFKEIKKKYPNHIIVLTFFSPSGYEIKKNNSIANIVTYLPLDTQKNAIHFIDIVQPKLVVFVKYEIWPNYLKELQRREIKTILISALFRKNQFLFKPYGQWIRKTLHVFSHIFVQNEETELLLNTIGYRDTTVTGDTRFDRVLSQLKLDNNLEFIKIFKQDKLCFVAGSTWPEDEALFINYINSDTSDTKYILVPHNIKKNQIFSLKNKLTAPTVLYSEHHRSDLQDAKVLIVDTIGLLSKIYFYADIAFIGGAMGHSGLHNILEAAVFGVPIVIGSNYAKFPEAVDLVQAKGVQAISSQIAFNSKVTKLIQDQDYRLKIGQINASYVKSNTGAVSHIISHL